MWLESEKLRRLSIVGEPLFEFRIRSHHRFAFVFESEAVCVV
jgi:hypothetical protein